MFRWSLLVSALVHGTLFLAWRTPTSGSSAGPPAPPVAVPSVFAGGALEAIAIAGPRAAEIPPPPDRTEMADEPAVEPLEAGALAVTLGTPGLSSGTASGSGDAAGRGLGGTGSRTTSPVPRSLVPEWDPPARVRGMRVTARVLVNAKGEPIGEVQLSPPTPDRDFNRRLAEKVLQMRYTPGRRDGQPVEAWAEITFVF